MMGEKQGTLRDYLGIQKRCASIYIVHACGWVWGADDDAGVTVVRSIQRIDSLLKI
jgi:hypothetical protein